jgi:hypothetical protein
LGLGELFLPVVPGLGANRQGDKRRSAFPEGGAGPLIC